MFSALGYLSPNSRASGGRTATLPEETRPGQPSVGVLYSSKNAEFHGSQAMTVWILYIFTMR